MEINACLNIKDFEPSDYTNFAIYTRELIQYFKNNYNPQSCVYYVDYNYFNGQSIQYLDNFKFIKTQPSFKNWWRIENKIKNREIKELEKEGLVIPIYNAGTKVYVWEKD